MTLMDSPHAPAGAAPEGVGRQRGRNVLPEIAARRRADIGTELGARTFRDLVREARTSAPAPRDATAPLLRPGLHLIAEVKRRSPSAGALAPRDADVVERARAYARGGAAIISVLVEPHWFGGSLDDLRAVRRAVAVPVLAKEFVVDARQLPLLRAAGADLVLLLAALHRTAALRRLVAQAREVGLEPLVEAHDERELERSVESGARIVGLNSRDLRTLRVDPEQLVHLRALVPDDRLAVAESGAREPGLLRDWRALGFDAALVGEALMRGGDDPARIMAATAAFVAAGRSPAPEVDPASADRRADVKICGVTDEAGIHAAIRSGADAIGLNLVPATPRELTEERAGALIALARRVASAGRPRIVGIFARRDPADVARLAEALDLDGIQLSRDGTPEIVDRMPRPTSVVLHLPSDADAADPALLAEVVGTARRLLARPNCSGVLLDASDPRRDGGTGRRIASELVAAVAAEVPVTLAGGLSPANVAQVLRELPVVGVDVASGVEPVAVASGPGVPPERPAKDPFRVALFVKRARAARLDRPQAPSRPSRVHPGLVDADERGRWGTDRQFGGRYVPETLVAALVQLERAWQALREDPRYWAQLRELLTRYVGRPSALYRADALAEALERRSGREPGRLRLYLKREDLNHTGAHKITNALGQALLTRRLGKSRVIAETGAGQHGVATATACALLDLPCVVYMGAEDIRRQAPNVLRMRALGAEVRAVTSGSATLKDAINEAMRDWVTNVATTHYVLGSAVGPHPYPTLVRDLQRVIGDEAAAQLREVEGRLPDAAVACVGGGSNAIGLLARFIGEPEVRLVGVEAAGEGVATGRHAAALAGGTPGVLHGARSYLLQDEDGQVVEAHSISAGLDYPGIGPQLSALYAAGRLEILAATDAEALDGLRLVTRAEGIIPALEPSHAIAALPRLLAADAARPLPPDALVLLGLSGRGDKDLGALAGTPEAQG